MMNERIRELAGRALDQAVPETWSALTGEQLNRFQEKFAELIVRECADIASINQHQYNAVGEYVLKHFGVEQ
jgi:hypothetical protein